MKIRNFYLLSCLVLLLGCSVDSLLVIDPLYTGDFANNTLSGGRAAVLDGDYPWQHELHLLLQDSSIDHVILSPLLYTAGRTSAVDYPDKQFHVLGMSDEQIDDRSQPDNLNLVPFSRMHALQEVADVLLPLTDDPELGLKISFLLLNNTPARSEEAAYIRETFASRESVRIIEYPGLPARRVVQQEIENAAVDQPHLLVSMLGMRAADSLSHAVEHGVPLITENLGIDSSMFSIVIGSIENDLYAAARTLTAEIQAESLPSSAQAVLYLHKSRFDDLRNLGVATDTQKR